MSDEDAAEKHGRLQAMVAPRSKWDLSDRDVAAIEWALRVVSAAENAASDGCSEHCRMMASRRGCTCGRSDLQAALDDTEGP